MNDQNKTPEQIARDRIDRMLADSGWAGESEENARKLTEEFAEYLHEHKDEITALRIYFDQPYRRREVTYRMVSELLERLRCDRPNLAPQRVWLAYANLDGVQGKNPLNELTALVALIRRVTGLDQEISPYAEVVEWNFKNWIFKRHAGAGEKFTEEQMDWLRMIRDHIVTSFHLERDDLDLAPFDAHGGMGRMWKLFGDETDSLIDEMNGALVA